MTSASGAPPGAERIEFDDAQYLTIRSRAMARAIRMRDRPGSYGYSDAEQHEIGLLGEEAVRLWFFDLGCDARSIADGDGAGNSDGDISVRFLRTAAGSVTTGSARIEVKTARLHHWSRYERELNAKQFERMTCDAIVWCSTPSKRPRNFVDIMGWLPRLGLTVSNAPRTSARQAQVRVQNELRTPGELLDWLREPRSAPLSQVRPREEGAPPF